MLTSRAVLEETGKRLALPEEEWEKLKGRIVLSQRVGTDLFEVTVSGQTPEETLLLMKSLLLIMEEKTFFEITVHEESSSKKVGCSLVGFRFLSPVAGVFLGLFLALALLAFSKGTGKASSEHQG